MRYLVLIWTFAIAACATMGSGNGNIAIDTASNGQPVTDANCEVRAGSGNWNVITPATAPVGNTYGDLRVVCSKSGYRSAEVVYRPSSPSNSNIGIGIGGGHVGVGLGFGIPISFGGRAYPSRITVELTPQ
jgi:hypothetical protein